jgi:hypothetical protein
MDMSVVVLAAGLALVAGVGVLLKRMFFPHVYVVEEPEFDMRAVKQPDADLSGEQKAELAKILTKRRFGLHVDKSSNRHP